MISFEGDHSIELCVEGRERKANERVEELEQYQRQNNLEIKGVPTGNNPTEVIQMTGEKVGEIIDEADIDVCHFVSTPKVGVSNIVVRFVRRNKRNDLLKKARKAKIECHALGLQGSGRVYVNEHLTQCNKNLLAKALQKKRQAGWKFVWTSGGKIFARKKESAEVVRIYTQNGLNKIAIEVTVSGS